MTNKKEMQAIELTPLMNNVLETDLECTVTDVVEANESQRRVPSSNSLASLSAMESAPRSNRPEEKEMVASIRVYEPDCDAGLFETSLQLNKNNQRRASVQRLGNTVEQDDASVEMMENKTTSCKRHSFTRCNNVSHFRRLQSTS